MNQKSVILNKCYKLALSKCRCDLWCFLEEDKHVRHQAEEI